MHFQIVKMSARLAAALSMIGLATAASAAETILYVSVSGSNSNPCTLAKPCRSIQYAIGKTPAGGELHVLNSGFYGNNATVNKSMTINGNGYTVTLGSPITINNAGATVSLRRLVLINNDGAAQHHGIDIVAAAAVRIKDCLVQGFVGHGIYAHGAGVRLSIVNSTFQDNSGSGAYIDGVAGGTTLAVDSSRFVKNHVNGLYLVSSVFATVVNSAAIGNLFNGIEANNGGGVTVTRTFAAFQLQGIGFFAEGSQMALDGSTSHGNYWGLKAGNTGTVRVSNSVFSNNVTGFFNSGSTILTRQNNIVSGNTTDVFGTVTPLGGI